MKRRAGIFKYFFILVLLLPVGGFFIANAVFPLPDPYEGKSFARVVLDSEGRPLRYFPDKKGEWRYRVKISEASPKYIEALIGYEDRFFYRHPGINPFSMARAAFQWMIYGRIISGGSTITMQVARIVSPHKRTAAGKIWQTFRALQLEMAYSKDEILEAYLNLAPFGGNLRGAQAASYAYFDRDLSEINHTEAALLAVLPQAPSRLRPDKHPEAARLAKNKVARRMLAYGYWDEKTVNDVLSEEILVYSNGKPMSAPLLAERLAAAYPEAHVIKTYINRDLQDFMEETLRRGVYSMAPGVSAAAVAVENSTGKVIAYAGSAEYGDEERFGYIDMAKAIRSPGSALKPFIYGMALDKGLIHSQSLLIDAPRVFSDYRAANFYQDFSGAVAAENALRKSLNVPAVQLLEHVGPEYFYSSIVNAGAEFPILGGKPNLSIALGGGGISLESLASLYTAFAREGYVLPLRFCDLDDTPSPRRIFSKEAAYIVYEILRNQYRSDHVFNRHYSGSDNRLAWKTGTSYGFRDALAIGTTKSHTIALWVGRPDNLPSPGQYGAVTAAPLLFYISDYLERNVPPETEIERPEGVREAEICWPSGLAAETVAEKDCHVKYKALIIKGATPATLPETPEDTDQTYKAVWLENPQGKRVSQECSRGKAVLKEAALWPRLTEPWIPRRFRRVAIIPPWDENCSRDEALFSEGEIIITGVSRGSTVRAVDENVLPEINISAAGARGKVSWYLNGAYVGQTAVGSVKSYLLPEKGKYQLLAIDEDFQTAVTEFFAD